MHEMTLCRLSNIFDHNGSFNIDQGVLKEVIKKELKIDQAQAALVSMSHILDTKTIKPPGGDQEFNAREQIIAVLQDVAREPGSEASEVATMCYYYLMAAWGRPIAAEVPLLNRLVLHSVFDATSTDHRDILVQIAHHSAEKILRAPEPCSTQKIINEYRYLLYYFPELLGSFNEILGEQFDEVAPILEMVFGIEENFSRSGPIVAELYFSAFDADIAEKTYIAIESLRTRQSTGRQIMAAFQVLSAALTGGDNPLAGDISPVIQAYVACFLNSTDNVLMKILALSSFEEGRACELAGLDQRFDLAPIVREKWGLMRRLAYDNLMTDGRYTGSLFDSREQPTSVIFATDPVAVFAAPSENQSGFILDENGYPLSVFSRDSLDYLMALYPENISQLANLANEKGFEALLYQIETANDIDSQSTMTRIMPEGGVEIRKRDYLRTITQAASDSPSSAIPARYKTQVAYYDTQASGVQVTTSIIYRPVFESLFKAEPLVDHADAEILADFLEHNINSLASKDTDESRAVLSLLLGICYYKFNGLLLLICQQASPAQKDQLAIAVTILPQPHQEEVSRFLAVDLIERAPPLASPANLDLYQAIAENLEGARPGMFYEAPLPVENVQPNQDIADILGEAVSDGALPEEEDTPLRQAIAMSLRPAEALPAPEVAVAPATPRPYFSLAVSITAFIFGVAVTFIPGLPLVAVIVSALIMGIVSVTAAIDFIKPDLFRKHKVEGSAAPSPVGSWELIDRIVSDPRHRSDRNSQHAQQAGLTSSGV